MRDRVCWYACQQVTRVAASGHFTRSAGEPFQLTKTDGSGFEVLYPQGASFCKCGLMLILKLKASQAIDHPTRNNGALIPGRIKRCVRGYSVFVADILRVQRANRLRRSCGRVARADARSNC